MSIDYANKARVMSTNLCKDIQKIDRRRFIFERDGVIEDRSFDCDSSEFDLLLEYGLDDIKEARRINVASYKRVKRIRERIERYLKQGTCIWLTLTFDEDTLSNTTEETRRRYVARYLKTQSNCYLANIDYGKSTQREHYHAVVLCDKVDMDSWIYGFAYCERIKNHVKTSTKISKYVTKLCNHAIKETTHRCCYIYSR